MALSQAATQVPAQRAGGWCTVGALIDRLGDEDRAWLLERLAQPARVVQHSWLSRVLAEDGHKVAAMTLGRHRRGDCECGK